MNDALFPTYEDLARLFPPDHSGLTYHELIDQVEERLLALGGQIQHTSDEPVYPLVHRFTPGLYIREITMPRGAVLTSRVHRTEHPYVVSKGCCMVFTEDRGWQRVEAPHTGITQPGTRRLLAIIRETVWTTFHVTDSTDVSEIESTILEPQRIPLLASGGPA